MPSSLQQQLQSGSSATTEPSSATSPTSSSSRDLAAASVGFRGRGVSGYSSRSYSGRGRGRGRVTGRSYRGGSARSIPNGEPPLCKFFLQGRCAAGATCRFKHSQEAAIIAAKSFRNAKQHSFSSSNLDDLSSLPFAEDNTCTRAYSPVAAAAVLHAKALQDQEPQPWKDLEENKYYSIDVEAVATGYGHSLLRDRVPARIALVDDQENVLLDEIVKHEPDQIVSYLTPLTGLTKLECTSDVAKPLEEVLSLLKEKLPKDAILVGQSIQNDITWLNLEKGIDFKDSFDIAELFRQRVPKDINAIIADESNQGTPTFDDDFPTKYRVFSLRHTVLHLLSVDIQQSTHDPVLDAKYSLILFNKYKNYSTLMLRATRDALHRAPPTPSFCQMYPVIDGVCLSQKSYKYKFAARFIWTWWTHLFGGALLLKFKEIN